MGKKIPNFDLAAMPSMTIKGNDGSAGPPKDLTIAEVIAMGLGGSGGLTDGDYGDVTVSGSGAVITIDANVVSDSKLRDSAALSVIGRSANSTGNPADISASAASDAVLRESGSTLGFGTVATAGIANDAVTDTKLRNSGALSVIGRSANSTGDPADISASAGSDAVLRESGSTVGFGTIATAGIAADAVTNAKLADMAAYTVKGNKTGSTDNPTDVTASDFWDMVWSQIGKSGIYGDGSDGSATITGGTTTLTKDMYYTDLTVQSSGVLATAGYRVHVNGTLTVDSGGIIQNDGGDGAAVTTAGTAGARGSLGGGIAGGSSTSGNGNNGATTSQTLPGFTGTGGTGGGGTGGRTGGTGSSTTALLAGDGGPFTTLIFYRGQCSGTASATGGNQTLIRAGFGGGGGGGNGTNTGAGGGGGGGFTLVVAYKTVNNGTIRAKGGNGGNASNSSPAGTGGGGGGGGGICILITEIFSGNEPTAPKGTGGTSTGAASPASTDGAAGYTWRSRW